MKDPINYIYKQMTNTSIYPINNRNDLEEFKQQHLKSVEEGRSYFIFRGELVANMLFEHIYKAHEQHLQEHSETSSL